MPNVPDPENDHARRACVALKRAFIRLAHEYPELRDENDFLSVSATTIGQRLDDLAMEEEVLSAIPARIGRVHRRDQVALTCRKKTDAYGRRVVDRFFTYAVEELQKVRIPGLLYS